MTLVELNNFALMLQQSIAGLSDPIDTTIQAQLVLDAQTLATDLQGYVSPAVTEVIVDNSEGVGTGIWSNSSSASPYGAGSVYNDLGEVFTWDLRLTTLVTMRYTLGGPTTTTEQFLYLTALITTGVSPRLTLLSTIYHWEANGIC